MCADGDISSRVAVRNNHIEVTAVGPSSECEVKGPWNGSTMEGLYGTLPTPRGQAPKWGCVTLQQFVDQQVLRTGMSSKLVDVSNSRLQLW